MYEPAHFRVEDRRSLFSVIRANPLAMLVTAGEGGPLAIFRSVDHYVSPGWYATKRETHKVVPTWNCVVVQVRGPARVDDSAAYLHDPIDQFTRQHEAHRAEPWSVKDTPGPFIAAHLARNAH